MTEAACNIPPHVAPELVLDFDYNAPPGHEEDVHRAWHRLHETNVPDIFWTPRNGGHWVVTRAEDIEVMQLDHERFSHEKVTIPKESQPTTLVPLELDPPEHTPFRALLSPAFGPKPVSDLEKGARALTVELIGGFLAKGECEFVADFAKRLPIVMFLRLVNLPLEDRDMLLEWTEWSVRARTNEERIASFEKLNAYVQKWIVERRARPDNDLFSKIVTAKVNGRDYTPQETFGMLSNVLFGGLDTVASSLGFVARCLAEQPELRRQLIEDPALIPNAIEEFLRRFGVPQTARVIVRDMEYKGIAFKKGEQILLSKTLHGLDPRRYEDPLRVDFHRQRSRHAAFGDGPHRCPGAGLARMEIRVFLEEWLKRIPDFRIKPGEKPVTCSGAVNGMLRLPLVWEARSI